MYLVNQFSPACQREPVRRRDPCCRLCTCPRDGAPGWRRRPPRAAPSPCAGPEAESCLEGDTWDDGKSLRPVSVPSRVSAGAHPAASSCRWCHRHRPPGGGNTPPPLHGTDVRRNDSKWSPVNNTLRFLQHCEKQLILWVITFQTIYSWYCLGNVGTHQTYAVVVCYVVISNVFLTSITETHI